MATENGHRRPFGHVAKEKDKRNPEEFRDQNTNEEQQEIGIRVSLFDRQ